MGIVYNAISGTIKTKSDLGNFELNYGESNGKPHTLTSINGAPAVFPQPTSAYPLANFSVTYTDFNKIKTLSEMGKSYELTYGVDDQRRKSVYSENGVTKLTRYYVGDYEEEVDAVGNVRQIHYLSGAILIRETNKPEKLYYSYSDFQGSLIALTDKDGTVVQRFAYDPWGARRNPNDWTLPGSPPVGDLGGLKRGYTGHEHLDAFGIINMNGRVYDPATAQFFSPDPFVQSPDNWQNYNRYAYCLNNPVMYTDPSGYQYIQQEEDNKFKWSFQDEIARTERELGLGTDGITSFNDTWNGYISAKSKGWLGSYSDFQQIADKQTRNPNYNGIVVVHTFFNSQMINEVGVTSKIATTIIVKLGGSNANDPKGQENSYDWDGLIKYLTYKSGGPATLLSFTGKLAQSNIIAKYKSGGDFLEALKDFKSVGKLGSAATKIGYAGLAINALQVGYGLTNGTNKTSDYLRLGINAGLTLITISNPIGIVAVGLYGVLDYYYGDQLWKSSGIDN